jgi:hypothetical protein
MLECSAKGGKRPQQPVGDVTPLALRFRRMSDLLDELKALLWEWDPIGVRDLGGPVDEYDDYAPELLILLRRGESVDSVKAYLDWLECEWIGLSQSGGQTEEIARRSKILFQAHNSPE